MSMTVTNNASGGDVVTTREQYRGTGVYRNLGEVVSTAPEDAATEKSSEYGNLEWVRHVVMWVQTDKDYDLIIERDDPDGSAASETLASAQTAPGAAAWARHEFDTIPGRAATFGLKNSEGAGNATAGSVYVELYGSPTA